jgi:hypothetical protein
MKHYCGGTEFFYDIGIVLLVEARLRRIWAATVAKPRRAAIAFHGGEKLANRCGPRPRLKFHIHVCRGSVRRTGRTKTPPVKVIELWTWN